MIIPTEKQAEISNYEARVAEQEMLYAFWDNDKYKMMNRLKADLYRTFDQRDVGEFQLDMLNITTKLIKQLSIVYRDPATRMLVEGNSEKKTATENYLKLIPSNINTIDKAAHRQAKLCNTSMTRIWFDKTAKKIKYSVIPSWKLDVETDPDNPYKAIQVSYTKEIGKKNYRIFWTDTEHWMQEVVSLFEKGVRTDKRLPVPGNKDTRIGQFANPYGVIPYSPLRLEEQDDFWGNGLTDVVDANAIVNFFLTDLWNAANMQAWGIPFMMNTGYGGKAGQSKEGEDGGKKIRIGVNHPITVEGIKGGENGLLPPDVRFINANPAIKEVLELITERIKLTAVSKGLSAETAMGTIKVQSGIAKIVDRMEMIELRRDDIEPCREYEQDRFEKTKAVWNYWAEQTTEGSSLTAIPKDAELVTDFAEVTVPKTPQEQQSEDDWYLEKDLQTRIDILKRDNPDLKDDEARKRIEANRLENDKFRVAPVVEGEEEDE